MNLLFESYMIKISEILKQISNGLACQYAGDCLSRKEKINHLNVHSKPLKKDNVVEFVSADHEDDAQSVDVPERSAA
jgi:hypothetical protein